MSIINVKVNNLRPEYDNLQEWCQNCNNVYIGRNGVVFINNLRFPYESSIWANPFKITKDVSRSDCIKKYEKYIRQKIIDENLQEELIKLKDKNLGCWCKPEACHGDILLKLIKEVSIAN